jgi:DnaJ-class molecular chaperone
MPTTQLVALVLAHRDYALGCLGFEQELTHPCADIKRRFRALALRLHPDKEPHPDAQQAFMLVRAVYERLTGEAC